MTSFPENPFLPGTGTMPAHMGRRPEVEDVLSVTLRRLGDGSPKNACMAFLYGPRGNGKTVLLRWLHAEAAAAEVTTVTLDVEDMKSPANAIRAIRLSTRRFRRVWEWLPPLRAEYHGFKLGTSAAEALPLAHVLKRGKGGILLTLDEAHEAPPEMLGFVLRAAQTVGESRPIAVVFAGTPGLETALLDAHASFWDRGEKLRIGLLSEANAQDVLARPFRDADLGVDDGAVAELVAAADRYPFFLQLYGRAAWRVVEASGGRTLLPEHVAPTLAAADGERQGYYFLRYREFSRAQLLPLARIVAEAFVNSAEAPADRRLSDAALEGVLAPHGDPLEVGAFLTARGYVWQDTPGDPSWAPGIPSLMDYMLENIPAA